MSKFKVGDKVRVKSLEECRAFQWDGFTKSMVEYCGRVGRVVQDHPMQGWPIVDFGDDSWTYLPEMLEPVPAEPQADDSSKDLRKWTAPFNPQTHRLVAIADLVDPEELAELRRKAALWDAEHPPKPVCPWCKQEVAIDDRGTTLWWHCRKNGCRACGPYCKTREEVIESTKLVKENAR